MKCPSRTLIQDFYENCLAPDEVVTDVLVPVPPAGTRGAYLKYVTRSSEDRPCVGATALVQLDADGRVAQARVAIGAVAGQPLRLPAVEQTMRGETPSDDAVCRGGAAVRGGGGAGERRSRLGGLPAADDRGVRAPGAAAGAGRGVWRVEGLGSH